MTQVPFGTTVAKLAIARPEWLGLLIHRKHLAILIQISGLLMLCQLEWPGHP
jgi:hypothetical protein